MIGAALARGVLARIAALPLLLLILTNPAFGLEAGHCDTPESLSASLRAEGHKIVATMNRAVLSSVTGDMALQATIVTATPDLSIWYMLRGDKPVSETASEICVSATGRNMEVNDYRQDSRPTVTQFNFDHDRAIAECDQVAKNFPDGEKMGIRCNSYAEVVRILEEDLNERIALHGLTSDGVLLSIVADADEGDYRMLATARQGATGIAASGFEFTLSEGVIRELETSD